jgi:hypothetical protein
MIVSAHNTIDRTRNLLTHSLPAKRVMVVNGVIQPGYEDAVQDILAKTGMTLTPPHRRGTYEAPKPTLVKAKRVKSDIEADIVVIPGDESTPAEYISLQAILDAEQVLNDSYEEDARRYDRPDREVMGRKRAA